MSEYSEFIDKIDQFDLFLDFLKEKYPGIKDEFFEWRDSNKNELKRKSQEIQKKD